MSQLETLTQMHPVLFGLWFLALGAMIGSLMNVVIVRVPLGKSIIWPGSHCPSCQKAIAFYDNVPLLSYLWLLGRCRHCKLRISPRYFVVELVSALFALLLYQRLGISFAFVTWFACFELLLAIAFIDLQHFIIPFGLLLPLALLGLLQAFWTQSLQTALPAAAFACGILLAVRAIFGWYFRKTGRLVEGQEAMGLGDPLLFGALALWISPLYLPSLLLLACVQGLLVAAFLWGLGKIGKTPNFTNTYDADIPQGAIPFGPFLAIAAIEIACLYMV